MRQRNSFKHLFDLEPYDLDLKVENVTDGAKLLEIENRKNINVLNDNSLSMKGHITFSDHSARAHFLVH